MASLDLLVKETRAAFIIAKSDGVLDTSEVIQIAVELAQKIQRVGNLSGSEKKSLLLHTLKKGLDDSGGLNSLPGFINASDETKAMFEEQVLTAASTTIDVLLSAVSGKIDLKKPSSWTFCLPMCMNAVKALAPKDQVLIANATKYTDVLLKKEAVVEDVKPVVDAPVVKNEALPGSVEESK
jgi:hypothetical protein